MKPAEQFEAFKTYQEVIGATDEQLASLLKYSCDRQPIGNFKDAIQEVLIRYLRYITGIPWIREYESGARPDAPLTHVKDGQYGTVHLMWSDDEVATPIRTEGFKIDPVTGEPYGDICEGLSSIVKHTVRLRVFRDAGPKSGQESTDEIQTPIRSAMDVLSWVKMRTQHPMMRQALSQYNIQLKTRFMGRIIDSPNMVNSTWEEQATANLEIFTCTSSNLRIPALTSGEFIEFNFDCEREIFDMTAEPEIVEC